MLEGLSAELVIEGTTAATEIRQADPAAAELPAGHFPDLGLAPHERLKKLAADARLVVRTGEARPYANVLPRCGVFFRTTGRPARVGRPARFEGARSVDRAPSVSSPVRTPRFPRVPLQKS